jgi:hypothetical protein
MDCCLIGNEGKVIVTIKSGNIKKKDISRIEEYKNNIEELTTNPMIPKK